MISAAFQRYLCKDYKKNPFIGNFQYNGKAARQSPTVLYSSPYIGSVVHSKTFDYFADLQAEEEKEQRRLKKIFVELSTSKDDWVKVTLR